MPDLATMQAAKPKCPSKKNGLKTDELCGKSMRFDRALEMWVCPDHGAVTAPRALVRRQGRVAA